MIDPDRILFIPSTRKGNGTGHLKRCLEWGAALEVQHLFSLDNKENEIQDHRHHSLCSQYPHIKWHDQLKPEWDLIVLDNRSTDALPEEFHKIPVIAIDESGKIRSSCSYALDILPALKNEKPNYENFGFFIAPRTTRTRPGIRKILVTFGGEDASSLGLKVLKSLDTGMKKNYKWTFIMPNRHSIQESFDGVECLDYLKDLRESLWTYDLVITSFGLTALEARASKVNVLLINPSHYHDRLSCKAGFRFLTKGYKRNTASIYLFIGKGLQSFVSEETEGIRQEKESLPRSEESLMDWLTTMSISKENCPVCGSSKRKAIGRFPGKSYFRCRHCRMKYMVQFRQKTEIYSKDYFFSEYKSQYGKTYLEDFTHIQQMAAERLTRINRKTGNLLDVGCAYGPFLLKAYDWGFKPWGLEISNDAVNYVKEAFPQLTVLKGDFEELSSDTFEKNFFDVITFWYVIEHFQDLQTVLDSAERLLKKDGVIALSTPHASGVSALFNPVDFMAKSPEDHFTLWDRKSARIALRRNGFRNIRFHITGHHPERFPGIIKKIFPLSVLMLFSRVMGWGDTFEIYAVKG